MSGCLIAADDDKAHCLNGTYARCAIYAIGSKRKSPLKTPESGHQPSAIFLLDAAQKESGWGD